MEMSLTFRFVTGESIAFLDTYLEDKCSKDKCDTRNIDFENFVDIDEYIAIKNDKEVDHVETKFDEFSQLEVVVPGQIQVGSGAINTYLQRQAAFKEVKAFVDKLMKEEILDHYSS